MDLAPYPLALYRWDYSPLRVFAIVARKAQQQGSSSVEEDLGYMCTEPFGETAIPARHHVRTVAWTHRNGRVAFFNGFFLCHVKRQD